MNKTEFIQLREKYLEALTTDAEEAALRDYLAITDDPDCDDLKAMFSYYAVGRAVHGPTQIHGPAQVHAPSHTRRPWPAMAAAAALVVAITAGIHLYNRQQCYTLAYGERITDRSSVINYMEAALTDIFSTGTDVGTELSGFFKEDNI